MVSSKLMGGYLWFESAKKAGEVWVVDAYAIDVGEVVVGGDYKRSPT